jgi:hypothetical protein
LVESVLLRLIYQYCVDLMSVDWALFFEICPEKCMESYDDVLFLIHMTFIDIFNALDDATEGMYKVWASFIVQSQ